MKKMFYRLAILSVFVFGMLGSGSAQSFDNIAEAIRTGNASALSEYFQGNVEINVKSAQNSYSKSQATVVLQNFFASHQPRSFAIAHQGASPEGSKYFIGNLSTSAGNFRAYVYAKQNGGTFVIQEIRFEEQ
ncbi:MAG: DUF4783 domain-containing protein [Chitinophagales bacterium]